MIDERWSGDVEEIGAQLRRLLADKSSIAHVRAAEAAPDGRVPELERHLKEFGLDELPREPELLTRVAYELGRAIAPVAYVETFPAYALLNLSGAAYGLEGDVPAALSRVLLRDEKGVFVCGLSGERARTACGDYLVRPEAIGTRTYVGGAAIAGQLRRLMRLVDSARLIGAGQAVLDVGVSYAKERTAGGRVIGSYQAVSHKLVNVAIALEGAELLLRKAVFTALASSGGDGAPSEIFAAFLRVKAVQAARLAATASHQVMAGNGFTTDYDCQLFSRRIRNWTGRLSQPAHDLADAGRILLDPARRDEIRWLWHSEQGLPIPEWAKVSDKVGGSSRSVA